MSLKNKEDSLKVTDFSQSYGSDESSEPAISKSSPFDPLTEFALFDCDEEKLPKESLNQYKVSTSQTYGLRLGSEHQSESSVQWNCEDSSIYEAKGENLKVSKAPENIALAQNESHGEIDLFSTFENGCNWFGEEKRKRVVKVEEEDVTCDSESLDSESTRNDVLHLHAAEDWMKQYKSEESSLNFRKGKTRGQSQNQSKQEMFPCRVSSSTRLQPIIDFDTGKLKEEKERKIAKIFGFDDEDEEPRIPEFTGFAFEPSFSIAGNLHVNKPAVASSDIFDSLPTTELNTESATKFRKCLKRKDETVDEGASVTSGSTDESGNKSIAPKRVRKEHPSSNTATIKKRQGLTSSKYNGVCWNKRKNKWRARLSNKGTREFLGDFDTEVEAAKAFDRRIKQVMSPQKYEGKLNFV